MDEHNYMDDQAGQVPEGYEPGSDADIHISSILFVGIIGSVLILVIVILLKALYYNTLEAERRVKQGKGIDVALADLRSKQLEQIGSYRWVNAHAGKVGIPIEEAMQLVWQEQSAHAKTGLEITDWDHNPSDQHAVPGDLVMFGHTNIDAPNAGKTLAEILSRFPEWTEEEAQRASKEMSGTAHVVVPEAAVEAAAEHESAAGGHK